MLQEQQIQSTNNTEYQSILDSLLSVQFTPSKSARFAQQQHLVSKKRKWIMIWIEQEIVVETQQACPKCGRTHWPYNEPLKSKEIVRKRKRQYIDSSL